jgi:FixJ family two-component response regulator
MPWWVTLDRISELWLRGSPIVADTADTKLRKSFAHMPLAAGVCPITYSSAEALRADMRRPSFNCLASDSRLPRMCGLQLQQRLRAARNETAIHFLTGCYNVGACEQAVARSCMGYFRSNSDFRPEVLHAIRASLSGRVARTRMTAVGLNFMSAHQRWSRVLQGAPY